MDLKDLCSGLFSDNLDLLGYPNQVVAEYQLNNRALSFWGPARTVLLEDCDDGDERIDLGLGFLESLKPGEVLVVQGSQEFAYFGELMTRLSIRQKIAGAVIHGLTRDHIFTQHVDFPIMAKGYSPKDIKLRGRVAAVDTSIELSRRKIEPGQWVFGDVDGLVVVPEEARFQLIEKIEADISTEEKIKTMIKNGASVKEILSFTKSF